MVELVHTIRPREFGKLDANRLMLMLLGVASDARPGRRQMTSTGNSTGPGWPNALRSGTSTSLTSLSRWLPTSSRILRSNSTRPGGTSNLARSDEGAPAPTASIVPSKSDAPVAVFALTTTRRVRAG